MKRVTAMWLYARGRLAILAVVCSLAAPHFSANAQPSRPSVLEQQLLAPHGEVRRALRRAASTKVGQTELILLALGHVTPSLQRRQQLMIRWRALRWLEGRITSKQARRLAPLIGLRVSSDAGERLIGRAVMQMRRR